MDTTALQQKIDTLTAQVATDESTLASDQAALATAKDELAQATLINALEALTPEQISAINAALAADNSTVSISLPPAPEPQPAQEDPAPEQTPPTVQ